MPCAINIHSTDVICLEQWTIHYLEEDVNGLDGHDLEDVVRPGEDGLELELDEGADQVEELRDPVPRQLGQDLRMEYSKL